MFLDRDGVVNDQTAFVNKPDDFRLLPGAAAAIRRLNEAKIPVIVVTNQGGIALGYLTEDDLVAIHERMAELLAAERTHRCPVLLPAPLTRSHEEVRATCDSRRQRQAPGNGLRP